MSQSLGKVKNFFLGSSKNNEQFAEEYVRPREYILSPAQIKDLGDESPHSTRIRTVKYLTEIVKNQRIDENGVMILWAKTADLYHATIPREDRHHALRFLVNLIYGQYDQLKQLRTNIFAMLSENTLYEDLPLRLDVFFMLTREGKDLNYFEEEAGVLLLDWMKDVMSSEKLPQFLTLLVTVTKFNSTFLGQDVLSSIVSNICVIATSTNREEDLKLSLQMLDAVVCYSSMPSHVLYQVIQCLCQVVNIAQFCSQCWQLMRKLLGTYRGQGVICIMCQMLNDSTNTTESGERLKRGAVYFIGMALWGKSKVSNLNCSATSVLPSFGKAIQNCPSCIVGLEVIQSIDRLVKKYGKDTYLLTWDIILSIIHQLVISDQGTIVELTAQIHTVLNSIEELYRNGEFNGSQQQYFEIVEICAKKRPESSIMILLKYKSDNLPPREVNWINNIQLLMDRFYRNETRTGIRRQMLSTLQEMISNNRQLYEDELLEHVILPHFGGIENDHDSEIRLYVVELLLDFIQQSNHVRTTEVITIIEKLLLRAAVSSRHRIDDNMTDIMTAIKGLVQIFRTKISTIQQNHIYSAQVFEVLINFLTALYKHDTIVPRTDFRKEILSLILDLRVDAFNHVGLAGQPAGTKMFYSQYLKVSNGLYQGGMSTSGESSPTVRASPCQMTSKDTIPYTQAIVCLLTCLEKDVSWPVIELLFKKLPDMLQNKAIFIHLHPQYIRKLALLLTNMVSTNQHRHYHRLIDKPVYNFSTSDFHASVYPVITILVSYHNMLDKGQQNEIIRCLDFALVSKVARTCISALTVCALEMQDVMHNQLPSVLQRISQIAATASMAVPLMEFLSSLLQVPNLYNKFNEEQYRTIFAISLPYTNPFKYKYYTVALAYHVIAKWFIKCKLTFRRKFVAFIVKGLHANVIRQFEENAALKAHQNHDSGMRGRTQSLNVGSSVHMTAKNTSHRIHQEQAHLSSDRALLDEKSMHVFHTELMETCIDMMARYTFSSNTNMPERSNLSQFLLEGGQSQSWLLGNKIITITTSGGAKVNDSGLCEKCFKTAKLVSDKQKRQVKDNQSESIAPAVKGRKRHRSAAVPRSSETVKPLKPLSQDDMLVDRRDSCHDHVDNLNPIDDRRVTNLTDSSGSPISQAGSNQGAGSMQSAVDSFLMGIGRSQPQHASIFSIYQCNCWCTQWCEVQIRHATGTVAWMLRSENKQDMFDMSLMDIANLLTSAQQVDDDTDGYDAWMKRHQQVDNEVLHDQEYESLHEQHFSHDTLDQLSQAGSHDDTLSLNSISSEIHDIQFGEAENSQDENGERDGHGDEDSGSLSECSLRRTNSSPDLTRTQQQKLSTGTLDDTDIQQTYQRSLTLKQEAATLQKQQKKDTPAGVPSDQIDNSDVYSSLKHPIKLSPIEEPVTPSLQRRAMLGKSVSLKLDDHEFEDLTNDDVTSKHRPLSKALSLGDSTSSSLEEGVSAAEEGSSSAHSTPQRMRHVSTTAIPHKFASLHNTQLGDDEFGGYERRSRSATISGARPARQELSSQTSVTFDDQVRGDNKQHSGTNPSFVFLQMYHSNILHDKTLSPQQRPLMLPASNQAVMRSLKMLDLVHSFETHNIGVVYVGPDRVDQETAILANKCGSVRYVEFLSGLGHLIRLADCKPGQVYVGGLNQDGSDGKFTYTWHEDFVQVIYHIATLMPNRENDKKCNAKKLHIGNDYVTIVYNDSGEPYKIGTIQSQFNYVSIVIEPLDHHTSAVTVQTKDDIVDIIGHTDTKVISDTHLGMLVRQMAVHGNFASLILQRQKNHPDDPYTSNWLDRLRHIKRFRTKVTSQEGVAKNASEKEHPKSPLRKSPTHHPHNNEDFTDFV